MSSRTGSHPFIGMLVQLLIRLNDCILEHNYPDATEVMMIILDRIKPEHLEGSFGKDLLGDIEKMVNDIEKIVGRNYSHTAGLRHTFIKKNRLGFHILNRRVSKILWDNKYLFDSTFMGIVPASTMKKEKETPEEIPFAERLPEEIM